MSAGGLQIWSRIERWSTVVLVVCLVAAGVGGLFVYDVYATEGTTTETRTVTDGRIEGSFTHRATITERAEDTPFEPNETVDDRSVYFQRIMPVLEGSFTLTYTGGDAPLDVRVRRAVVVENVESTSEGESTVYWRQNRSIRTVERTVESGERVTVPFELNVTATRAAARNVSERVGAPGETQISVVTTVVATRQDGASRSERVVVPLSVDPDGDVYRVSADPSTESFSRTVTERVPADPGPLRSVGGPVLLVVGLLGTVGAGLVTVRDDLGLSETERAWLRYRDDRADFEEWINRMTLPDDAVETPDGEAETLGDLVDFAIDTDAAVVEDPERGAYFVFDDGRTFAFDPPETPAAVDADRPEPETNVDGDSDDERDDDGEPSGDPDDERDDGVTEEDSREAADDEEDSAETADGDGDDDVSGDPAQRPERRAPDAED
jgi:hypothetical protein